MLEDRKKEASMFLAKQLSHQNSRCLEFCQVAEKHNSELLAEKCAPYIKDNVWEWSDIQKLPMVTKSILKASKKNMDLLRNTTWPEQDIVNHCNYKCRSTKTLNELQNKLNF